MQPLSLEALEDLAVRLRTAHCALLRAALTGAPLPPRGLPAGSRLAAAYPLARTTDPALGVLFAEAVALEALWTPSRSYDAAWQAEPVVLPGENPIPWRALETQLALESAPSRRAALADAADARAKEHLAPARALIEALRTVGSTLGLDTGPALHGALGLGDAPEVERAAEAVLAATEEGYRELEAWVRPRVGLPRSGELAWCDRLRTLAMPRSTELIPLGDRPGIASRWIARIGLPETLAGLRDDTVRPSLASTGVRALTERPGERAVVSGTPALHARGAMELTGAVAEALSLVLPREARVSSRLGIDRVHHALAETLGRRLFLAPAFVVREASVDRAVREPVLLECLYTELFVIRVDAALARFGLDVLARAHDLPARLREYLARATGSAPAPAWAAHFAARSFELRPGARTLAALLEPRVHELLRTRHDEDWFRNPRAGETVRGVLEGMRALGVVGWAAGEGERASVLEQAPLARRVDEALREARR